MCGTPPVSAPGKTEVAGAAGGGPQLAASAAPTADIASQLTAVIDALKALAASIGSGSQAAVAGASGDATASGGGPDAKGGVEQLSPEQCGMAQVEHKPSIVGGDNGGPEQSGKPEQKGDVGGKDGEGDDEGPGGKGPDGKVRQDDSEVGGRRGRRHGGRGRGHDFAPGRGHIRHGDNPSQVVQQTSVGGVNQGAPAKDAPKSDVGGVNQGAPAKDEPKSDVGGVSQTVTQAPAKDSDVGGVSQTVDQDDAPAKDEEPKGDVGGVSQTVDQDDAPAKDEEPKGDVGGVSQTVDQDDAPAKDEEPKGDVGGVSQTVDETPAKDEEPKGDVGGVSQTVEEPAQSAPTQSTPKAPVQADVWSIDVESTNTIQIGTENGTQMVFSAGSVSFKNGYAPLVNIAVPAEGFSAILSDGTRISAGWHDGSNPSEPAGTPRDLEIIAPDGSFHAVRTDDYQADWAKAPITSGHLLELASILMNNEYVEFGGDPTQGQVVQQSS